jgi:hypothetical protein
MVTPLPMTRQPFRHSERSRRATTMNLHYLSHTSTPLSMTMKSSKASNRFCAINFSITNCIIKMQFVNHTRYS